MQGGVCSAVVLRLFGDSGGGSDGDSGGGSSWGSGGSSGGDGGGDGGGSGGDGALGTVLPVDVTAAVVVRLLCGCYGGDTRCQM